VRLLFKGVFRVEGNAIFGYDGGNHFGRNGKARPRANIAASEKHGERKTATYSRAKTGQAAKR